MKIRRAIEVLNECEKDICGYAAHNQPQGHLEFYLDLTKENANNLKMLLDRGETLIKLDITQENKDQHIDFKYDYTIGCRCTLGAICYLDLDGSEVIARNEMSKIDGDGVPYTVIFDEIKNKYKPVEIFTAPVTGTYAVTNGSITLLKEMKEGDSVKISDVVGEDKL